MRNTDHLTREQLRESMCKPLSPNAAKRLRKATEEDGWLLAYNLQQMESDAIQIIPIPRSSIPLAASGDGSSDIKDDELKFENQGWVLHLTFKKKRYQAKIAPPPDVEFSRLSIINKDEPDKELASWTFKEIIKGKSLPLKGWDKKLFLFAREGRLVFKVEN